MSGGGISGRSTVAKIDTCRRGSPAEPPPASSGSALANVWPVVVEASLAQVPLLVLGADRPPELQDAGANQTMDRVRFFGGGYGASYLARIVGQKKAREIWYLCRQYDAAQALAMGLVNAVVPYERLEEETVQWCREILANSPIAIRCLKAAFNADCDSQAGLQELAGNATMLFYMTEEGREGRNAFVEKRKPDFSKFPRRP